MTGIDVQEVMRGIRERVRIKASRRADLGIAPPPAMPDLLQLRGFVGNLAAKFKDVGAMPPAPPTLRAQLGGHAVRLTQRSLFWLTGQLREAHAAWLQAERAQLDTLQSVLDVQRYQQSHLENMVRLGHRNQQVSAGLQYQWEEWTPRWREMQERIEKLQADLHVQRDREAGLRKQLEEQAALLKELTTPKPEPDASEQHAFHFAHMAEFRGEPHQILERLAVYAGHWGDLPSHSATPVAVDLGCGRGEWLSILRGEGVSGYGVDRNPLFVAECRKAELSAVEDDALRHLSTVPDGSLHLITAFHLVEHLTSEALLDLLRNAYRALLPGGRLIIETPNVANLLVGAHTFHLDPSHVRPLAPELAVFILTRFGFQVEQELFLQPFPPEVQLGESSGEVGDRFNHYMYSGRDYGVVASKPQTA